MFPESSFDTDQQSKIDTPWVVQWMVDTGLPHMFGCSGICEHTTTQRES
jgi:hypothetical protein